MVRGNQFTTEFGRSVPRTKYADYAARYQKRFETEVQQVAQDMTREMGKPLAETRGDVQEAIDMTYYIAGEGRRLFGQTTPS